MADWVATFFLGTVTLVASWVFLFAYFYIRQEKFKLRFCLSLAIFVISIALLIIRGDPLALIFGWDSLGITSFLLVIFFNNKKSTNAGLLTALTNRIGDIAIILFFAFLLIPNTWNFFILSYNPPAWRAVPISLLLLARITKSAQIPFSAWLPAAIAAPTPVSALVHSSTLVTAGVYLLIRIAPAVPHSHAYFYLSTVGVLTLLVARATALTETDLKKVIALSTLSQLGLMVAIVGLGFYKMAFFHLNTHAFFKSLLFIGAGDIIHSLRNEQDLRSASSPSPESQLITALLLTANLSLMGAPFLAGFYSKDMFLETTFSLSLRGVLSVSLYIRVTLTAAYALRLITFILSSLNAIPPVLPRSEVPASQQTYSYFLLTLSIVRGRAISITIFPTPVPLFLPPPLKSLTLILFFAGLLLTLLSPPLTAKPAWASLIYLDLFLRNRLTQIILNLSPALFCQEKRGLHAHLIFRPSMTQASLFANLHSSSRSLAFMGLLFVFLALILA